MKIEVLYPEVCCLYGDKSNADYLKKCLPECEMVYTSLTDEPRFAFEPVDLIYLCSISERSQELVLERLKNYKNVLRLLIDEQKCVILAVGNAMELFGQYIQKEDGEKIEALGITDTYAVRQKPDRFNSLGILSMGDMTLVGYTTRFSHSYGLSKEDALFKVVRGSGINPDTDLEGVRKGRFFATYTVGPLLISNPDFTRFILDEMGAPEATVAFEKEAREAYEKRLAGIRAAKELLQ